MSLSGVPGHLARRFHQISTAMFEAEMRKAGLDLTPVQYAALVALRDEPSIDQATLAAGIAYDRTTIGGVVDRLVDKGLVTRVVSTTDRRARTLTVSERGHAILRQAEPLVARVQKELLGTLDRRDAELLLQLLGKVVSALGDVTRTAPR